MVEHTSATTRGGFRVQPERCNNAVQRWDPTTGKTIPYVHPAPDDQLYQRGDVIHLDCGFNYLGFASDWQKVA